MSTEELAKAFVQMLLFARSLGVVVMMATGPGMAVTKFRFGGASELDNSGT
jgi:hypothetical protein